MELIKGIQALTSKHSPSVVSIGNYDGVHLGHQHVIATLLAQSEKLQAVSTVVTFEPLAKEFFRPNSVLRLSSIEERAQCLFELGVERVLCIDFTTEFANYSPKRFVNEVLVEGLGVKYLCVGDDFKFGKDRAGDFEFLRSAGTKQGFSVTAHNTFELGGQRVSSGRVREALSKGNFELAETLLGRPYTITGLVSQGEQLGRTIDFPTANIVLPDVMLPVNGVYAVVATVNQQNVRGIANVGKRPTVGGKENRLEVHMFDFDDDIYGEELTVRFVKKVRDERKFESLDSLKSQIRKDADSARRYLSNI